MLSNCFEQWSTFLQLLINNTSTRFSIRTLSNLSRKSKRVLLPNLKIWEIILRIWKYLLLLARELISEIRQLLLLTDCVVKNLLFDWSVCSLRRTPFSKRSHTSSSLRLWGPCPRVIWMKLWNCLKFMNTKLTQLPNTIVWPFSCTCGKSWARTKIQSQKLLSFWKSIFPKCWWTWGNQIKEPEDKPLLSLNLSVIKWFKFNQWKSLSKLCVLVSLSMQLKLKFPHLVD